MKYFIWKQAGLLMAIAGGFWLYQLISQQIPFLVLPSVLKYQGALLLFVIGILIVLLTSKAGQRTKLKQKLKQQYPLQPWMWRPDWAQRKSVPSKRVQMFTTVFALIWTLLFVPVVIAAIPKFRHELLFMIVFGYGFPAMAFSMLLWQAVKWLKYLMAGQVNLRLLQLPVRLGESFQAEVNIPLHARSIRYEAELVCLHERVETRDTGDGYESSWVRDEVWRELILPRIDYSSAGAHLYMKFQLPGDKAATQFEKDNGIHWYVVVRAISRAGRTRFEREFQVPVVEPAHPKPQFKHHGRATFQLPDMEEHVDGQHEFSNSHSVDERVAVTQKPEDSIPPNAIEQLQNIGVHFNKDGIEYEDSVWTNTGIYRSRHAWTLIPLILTIAFSIVFYTEVIVKGKLFALPSGMGVVFGLVFLAIVLFFRHYRFSIVFTAQGIVRNSQLLLWQWQTLFPWEKIHRVKTTASSSVSNTERRVHYKKVVVYGNTYKENLTLSPGFRDEQHVDILRQLIKQQVAENNKYSSRFG